MILQMLTSLPVRSGNKKVTLVNNLETFHIDPAQFAHKCQVRPGISPSLGNGS